MPMTSRAMSMLLVVVFSVAPASPSIADDEPHHHGGGKKAEAPGSGGMEHESHGMSGMAGMEHGHSPLSMGLGQCGESDIWDLGTAMCMPFPRAGASVSQLMVHGNAFGVGIAQEGPRGRNAFASPNMFMVDVGTTLGDSHYLNLDYMGTFEKWTFPSSGYPELLQIGEEDAQGRPYLDAQHPHSSPVMGLTLSDTIRLGAGKDYLKIFFAPRGETTDGPIAFMHRPTGMASPDAPLGHHIGQDVGHITSTVVGASFKWGATWLEASAFHGEEPEPAKVDLPLGSPDSVALRVAHEISPRLLAMASAAYVAHPEPNAPDIRSLNRYSASLYTSYELGGEWRLHTALIYGLIANYDRAPALSSITGEIWLHAGAPRIWGRVEILQRTPAELQIPGAADPNRGRWVEAVTIGYSHRLVAWEGLELAAGGAVSKYFVPAEFSSSYGGNPWAAKVFLQLSGMRMWKL